MNPAIGRKEAEARVAGRQEKFQAQVTRAANKLGQSLRPSDEEELGKVRLKLLNAGFRNENAVAVLFGIKLILMLLGLAIAFPIVALKLGLTRNALHHHGRERRNWFLPARHGRGQPEEEAVRVDLSGPARCAGPDGCLCRGGPRPRCRHAQGDHRAGRHHARSSARSSRFPTSSSRWADPARMYFATLGCGPGSMTCARWPR